jgi:hypothetical protein
MPFWLPGGGIVAGVADELQAFEMRSALQTVYLDRIRITARHRAAMESRDRTAANPWAAWAAAADPWKAAFGDV